MVLLVLWLAARRSTAGVPGRFQAAVEMLVDMVNEQANALVHGDLNYIAPLALTVFCWVVAHERDRPAAGRLAPVGRQRPRRLPRPLPTADLNATLGMSVGVLLLVLYYSIKIKGLGGWIHELLCAPFGMVKLSSTR